VPATGNSRPTSAASPGAGEDRHAQRPGAGDRVGGELLADAADRPTALGQRDGRWREERGTPSRRLGGRCGPLPARCRVVDGRRRGAARPILERHRAHRGLPFHERTGGPRRSCLACLPIQPAGSPAVRPNREAAEVTRPPPPRGGRATMASLRLRSVTAERYGQRSNYNPSSGSVTVQAASIERWATKRETSSSTQHTAMVSHCQG
jgi:hypothetical protein